MRTLVLAAAALLATTVAGNAIIINVGDNPTSATGHFSDAVGGGAFADQITFRLVGGPQFFTFASATNDFLSSADFITGFTGQLFNSGPNLAPGGGDDFAVNPAVLAVPCPTGPSGCQILAGSATLNPGSYYLNLSGTGGGSAGYGGDITTRAVPGPLAGTGIPGLIAAAGFVLFGLHRNRRRRVAGKPN
jgi:hypothetical protein